MYCNIFIAIFGPRKFIVIFFIAIFLSLYFYKDIPITIKIKGWMDRIYIIRNLFVVLCCILGTCMFLFVLLCFLLFFFSSFFFVFVSFSFFPVSVCLSPLFLVYFYYYCSLLNFVGSPLLFFVCLISWVLMIFKDFDSLSNLPSGVLHWLPWPCYFLLLNVFLISSFCEDIYWAILQAYLRHINMNDSHLLVQYIPFIARYPSSGEDMFNWVSVT